MYLNMLESPFDSARAITQLSCFSSLILQEHVVRLAAVEALAVLFENHQVVVPNQYAPLSGCDLFNMAVSGHRAGDVHDSFSQSFS